MAGAGGLLSCAVRRGLINRRSREAWSSCEEARFAMHTRAATARVGTNMSVANESGPVNSPLCIVVAGIPKALIIAKLSQLPYMRALLMARREALAFAPALSIKEI